MWDCWMYHFLLAHLNLVDAIEEEYSNASDQTPGSVATLKTKSSFANETKIMSSATKIY